MTEVVTRSDSKSTRPTSTTHVSLLDVERWGEFDDLYAPFVEKYLRILRDKHKVSLSAEDIEELRQQIMVRVFQKLPDFQHNGRTGAFRAWLRTLTTNCLWDYLRARPVADGSNGQAMLEEVIDSGGAMSDVWDREYQHYMVQSLLARIAHEFEATTWSAFLGVTFQEGRTAEVARRLGITSNAVRIAKSRVLQRLRQVGAEILDSDLELPGRRRAGVEETPEDGTD